MRRTLRAAVLAAAAILPGCAGMEPAFVAGGFAPLAAGPPPVWTAPVGPAPGAWSIFGPEGYMGCRFCGHTGNPAFVPPPYAYSGYTAH